MSRKFRSHPTEVPPTPAAMVPDEVPLARPSPPPASALVVPPSRLHWAASRGYGRPIAHAFVVGAPRSVCRTIVTNHGTREAEENLERCHECQTILRAQEADDDASVPNLPG